MSEIMWAVYKMFYDEPRTPKELQCIPCKVVAGTATLSLAGASTYFMIKKGKANAYVGMGFAGLAATFFATSLILYKVAYDYKAYNEKLIKYNMIAVRAARKEYREKNATPPQEEQKI